MGETSAPHEDLDLRVLITDGGQMEPPEEEDQDDVEITRESETGEKAEDEQEGEVEEEGEQQAEAEHEESDAQEEEGAEQEEGEQEEEEAEADESGQEEEAEEQDAEAEDTQILELELDGLYLDLLGLEVDLDEVELDIIAATGEGKLLGNLLSAVSGLLDSPGMVFGDDGGLRGMLPSLPTLSPIQRAKELASALADRIRSIPQQLGANIVAAIPFEQLLSQFFEALVDQLLSTETDNGGEEAEAEAA